jgi:hypothetical protein
MSDSTRSVEAELVSGVRAVGDCAEVMQEERVRWADDAYHTGQQGKTLCLAVSILKRLPIDPVLAQ